MRTTFLTTLLVVSMGIHAQSTANVPFDKEHIADAGKLKTALAAVKKGDALALRGGVDFPAAMAAYAEALAINPDNAELHYKMGVCQLNGPAPALALEHFQRAAALDPLMPRVHYLLAHALQLNAKWDEAIAEFKKHGEVVRLSPDPDRTYNMVDKRLRECRSGKALMATPTKAVVTNAGGVINTEGGEYGALVDGKGNLYFTSRRQQGTGGKVNKVTNTWYEDIFTSRWTAGGWAAPIPVQGPLNSAHNDATVALADDGSTMIIYRDEKNGGDLFQSTLVNGAWSEPVALPATVNSTAQESSAWRSGDGQWLYFVSSRDGGLGGSDIYRSPWDKALATWGAPENLGPNINTPFDEEGVFAPGDGSTIYFASQGHNSMGGYDLFKATCSNGAWSKPENLGWPINSPGDDQFLVLSADGQSGYFSSTRAGGMGEDDIYQLDLPAAPKVQETAMLASAGGGIPMAESEQQLRLITFVKGLKMMEAAETSVELMSLEEPHLSIQLKLDSATGAYTAEVPAGKEYVMLVKAPGYLPHFERVAEKSGQLQMDMDLKPSTAGSSEVMRSIFFKSGTATLDEPSTVVLQALAQYLKADPKLRLEVGGHTDSEPGPIPNQELSEARAKVVVHWLVSNGIAPDRLEAKGYGESKPLAPNDSEEHKAMNRRTEIRVL